MYQITREEIELIKSLSGLRATQEELKAQENINRNITGEMSQDFYLGFASGLKMIGQVTTDPTQATIIKFLLKRVVEFL